MLRVSLLVLAASSLFAQPPVVKLPEKVSGKVSDFVVVKAEVTGATAVRYVPLDPGLSVFPSELLTDQTVLVVISGKPGSFRVLAYSGNSDGPSDPTITTVVIGGSDGDKDPPPVDKDPPVTPPTGGSFYAVVVCPDGPIAPELKEALALPGWDAAKKDGNLMKPFQASDLPNGIPKPAKLPAVVLLRVTPDGKGSTVLKTVPVPQSDAAIKELFSK